MTESPLLEAEIEESEQKLIQHLHTSGIRKEREKELIDEVINIRRLRRRLITNYKNDLDNTSQKIQEIKHNIDDKWTKIHQEQVDKCTSLQLQLQQQQNQNNTNNQSAYITRLEEQLKIISQSYEKKYEQKFRYLESKLNEMNNSKSIQDNIAVDQKVKDIVAVTVSELERSFSNKIERYITNYYTCHLLYCFYTYVLMMYTIHYTIHPYMYTL